MKVNVAKAILAAISLLCITGLMLANTITPDAGMIVITAISFYAIGNGVGAATTGDTKTLIHKKEDQSG